METCLYVQYTHNKYLDISVQYSFHPPPPPHQTLHCWIWKSFIFNCIKYWNEYQHGWELIIFTLAILEKIQCSPRILVDISLDDQSTSDKWENSLPSENVVLFFQQYSYYQWGNFSSYH
jgi:hypothetical protein